MYQMKIDLHVHSTASDGKLTPEELVDYSIEKGLAGFALTDHDTTDGIAAAQRAAKRKGIEFIPGVEISSIWEPGQLHVLGYFIQPENPVLRNALSMMQKARNERNPQMIKLLNELGFMITLDDVKSMTSGSVIGRPHIAHALLKAGYIQDYREAFEKYISPGMPAYIPKERMEPAEAVRIIKSAGGIPVIAHPKFWGYNGIELEKKIEELKEIGFEGIEAIYSDHTEEEIEYFTCLGKKLGLIITGGSDFHFFSEKGPDLGCVNVPYECLTILKEKCGKLKK